MSITPRANVSAQGPEHAVPPAGSPVSPTRRGRAGHAAMALGLLATCATTSVLSSAEDPFGARLDLQGRAHWVCVDHRRVALSTDDHGIATLEPGRRVTIGLLDETPVDGRCTSAVSFVPRAGQVYLAELEAAPARCGLAVYRQVRSNRLGLGSEPSVAGAVDCAVP